MNRQVILDQVVLTVLDLGRNQKLLTQLPHEIVENLALAACLMPGVRDADEDPHDGSPEFITYNDLFLLGVGKEELLQRALDNSVRCLQPQFESLVSNLGMNLPESQFPPVFVLTNQYALYGAACVFYPGLLAKIARLLGGDFYIVPSSIHEVLILPVDAPGIAALHSAQLEANRLPDPEFRDILNDDVYRYFTEDEELRLVQVNAEEPECAEFTLSGFTKESGSGRIPDCTGNR